MSGRSTPLPSPRAHLSASLALYDALAESAGGLARFPGAELWRRLLARPRALPATVPASANGLKCDGYLTVSEQGPAWGFACNDRWEGRAFWRIARQLAEELDGAYAIEAAEQLRDALGGSPGLTISVGFDAPGRPPRLKLYIQEPTWGTGVGTTGELRELASVVGAEVPAGLPDGGRPGVVTVTLLADGSHRLKLYYGGSDARRLASEMGAALPEHAAELDLLGSGMATTSPGSPSFYYATVRLGTPVRVALNKIYEHERLGFGADRSALGGAWEEVEALFAHAGGATDAVSGVRASLGGMAVVPTATALERGGRSADVYMAAWPAPLRR